MTIYSKADIRRLTEGPPERTPGKHMYQLRRRIKRIEAILAADDRPREKQTMWRAEKAALEWAVEQLAKK